MSMPSAACYKLFFFFFCGRIFYKYLSWSSLCMFYHWFMQAVTCCFHRDQPLMQMSFAGCKSVKSVWAAWANLWNCVWYWAFQRRERLQLNTAPAYWDPFPRWPANTRTRKFVIRASVNAIPQTSGTEEGSCSKLRQKHCRASLQCRVGDKSLWDMEFAERS